MMPSAVAIDAIPLERQLLIFLQCSLPHGTGPGRRPSPPPRDVPQVARDTGNALVLTFCPKAGVDREVALSIAGHLTDHMRCAMSAGQAHHMLWRFYLFCVFLEFAGISHVYAQDSELGWLLLRAAGLPAAYAQCPPVVMWRDGRPGLPAVVQALNLSPLTPNFHDHPIAQGNAPYVRDLGTQRFSNHRLPPHRAIFAP